MRIWKNLSVLALLMYATLQLTACPDKGGNAQQINPPPPVPGTCQPPQPCYITGNQCPAGQIWQNTQCVPFNQVSGGYSHLYGNLTSVDSGKAKSIIQTLTGQLFCWGTQGVCPDYNQGSVEIYIAGNGAQAGYSQVVLTLGGNRYNYYGPRGVDVIGVAQHYVINSNAGSQLQMQYYGWRFDIISQNTRLDTLANPTTPSDYINTTINYNGARLATGNLQRLNY